MTDPSNKMRAAKDALVASLFELSKSANQAASSIVDFYNAVDEDEEDDKVAAFATLTDSLQALTSSTDNFHQLTTSLGSHTVGAPNGLSSPTKQTTPTAPAAPKKRAEKDPNAPKKPLTVFFAYSAYVRQELRENRQKEGLTPLSSTEITQEISKKWKELNLDEKEKWKQAYNIELQNYQLEKQKYLEAKKNGTHLDLINLNGVSHAPVPIPIGLLQERQQDSSPLKVESIDVKVQSTDSHKRSREEDGESHHRSSNSVNPASSSSSSEKKKKKKKKDKKKDKSSS